MSDTIFELLRGYFHEYGYWTVGVALLLENAGIPVPGETTLLFASFLAFSERQLHLPAIIVTGIAACTIGDNLGYAFGYYGRRPMLTRYQKFFRIPPEVVERGERLFARYGPVAIFFARFLFGMRVIAGPLAGALLMPWRKFLLFNLLGATLWVVTICLLGYFFGSQWSTLLRVMKSADLILLLLVLAAVLLFWWRNRRMKAAASQQL